MGRRNRLVDLLIYAMLQMRTMFGLPLRPEDVEAITRQLQGTVAIE